jgi:serine/threonine-protein kinase
MAFVFRARDLREHRDVAVKILRPEVATAIGSARFLREIAIERRLSHPGVVPVLDAGDAGGLPYYVMPLVDGESLRARLEREHELPLPEAVRIATAMALALEEAHRQGIIHRDIKPENVLLSGGSVLVADFGIARAVTQAGGERLTDSGMAVGTPSYMSPEQGSGDSRLDARTDVYALGCVLYEMVAGEPPFTGPSGQAIVARHMQERPRALYVIRPTVPAALETLVLKCLAKVPADRYASGGEVARALSAIDLARPSAAGLAPRRRRRRIALAAVGLGAAALAAWAIFRDTAALDPDRIVVFPLVAAESSAVDREEGARAGLMISQLLEHTEPMKWLDGRSLVDPARRDRADGIAAGAARTIARAQRARYFVDGTIARGDSLRVTLRLHDAEADAPLAQETAAGAETDEVSRLVLDALVRLLPRITRMERGVNVSMLGNRQPAAVANWLQGEREFRRSRFDSALVLLRRAVDADSALAPAALRGAEAASWLNRADEARSLVAVALRQEHLLAPTQRWFAHALDRYVAGDANAAIVELRPALAADPDFRDGWMLLGEIHLHLLPDIVLDSMQFRQLPEPLTSPADSLAAAAFERVAALDPNFAPALEHLIEIEARRGRLEAAERYLGRFRTVQPDSARKHTAALVVACAGSGPDAVNWTREIQRKAQGVVMLGAVLMASPTASARSCAMRAFRAVLDAKAGSEGDQWAALLGAQSMLVAGGQQQQALALVDSAVLAGMTPAPGLFVLDAAAGVDVGARAGKFVDQLGAEFLKRGTQTLWLVGSWAGRTGDTARVAQVARELAQRKAEGRGRLDSLMADVFAARVTLARGDSAGALRLLEAIHPTAPREDLAWSLWEPLAGERLLLARLLMASRQFARAHRIAGEFDRPDIIVFQLYLRQSLALRAEAAESLGRADIARGHRERLRQLDLASRAR